MKISHFITAGILLGAASLSANAADIPTKYTFAENSLLSKGHWVKITVPVTGMYEITYDQLKEMGFNDPSSVGVYGRGGADLDFNFTTSGGSRLYKDNPQQLPVLHTGKKLVFYGTGAETVKASSSNKEFEVVFNRNGHSIYSDVSVYFLSDAEPVTPISTMKVDESTAVLTRTKAYSYAYYEKDLSQGTNGAGQVFYGEALAPGQPLSFDLNQQYAKDNPIYLSTRFAMGQGGYGTLSFSLNGTTWTSGTISSPSSSVMKEVETDMTTLRMAAGENGQGTGRLTFDISENYGNKLLALDWWIGTYEIDLGMMSTDKNFTQQQLAVKSNYKDVWKIQVPKDAQVWYINDTNNPVALEISDYNQAIGASSSTADELVVFNPAKQLNSITEWSEMENQNIHGLKNSGVELLIFSTTDMLPYANRIAAAHEKYDGIKCLVVTPQQIYNEFSNGKTDPMAYRAIAKMFYHNEKKPLKNVLFLGKMTGDIRNVRNASGFSESHIAYQEATTKPSEESICVMDYYGCVTDYVTFSNSLASLPISVGVGLLPISTYEEGSNVASKIEEYLSRQDYSNLVNETMLIACEGDKNLHDMQAVDYSNMMQQLLDKQYSSKYSNHLLRFDGLSNKIIKQQFKDALERGKAYSLYFGHGIDYGLNGGKLNISDLMALDNKELTFQFMAACDLCSPDQGHQGMGDVGVTRARRGFIGSFVGTRSVMSNDNESLARTFYNSLYYKNGIAQQSNLRTEPVTVGEAYAISKNNETSSSQMAFLLIGDPAITLPLALGKVQLTVKGENVQAGDLVQVTGKVLDNNSQINRSYNGYATVKLMQPAINVQLPVKYPIIDTYYNTDITDLRLATVKAEVKNGEFTVMIPVPEKINEFMSSSSETVSLPIYAGTYDPSTKLGCSGVASTTVGIDGADRDPSAITDTEKPVVTLTYDNLMQTMTVEASDNVALMPGIGNGAAITFAIDGKMYNVASDNSNGVSTTYYTTSLSTAHLEAGKTHTARVFAVDLAGNKSETQTVEFTVGKIDPVKLTASSTYAIDEIEFSIEGLGSEECVMIMTDMDGNTVYRGEASGNKIVCDISDLKPGIYRASVRHDSPKGALLYSNWVEFTVID